MKEESEEKKENQYPRVIWMFFSGTPHQAILKMMDITRRTLQNNWRIIYLTPSNISLYLDISTFPDDYTHLIPSQQSDYIRLRLLTQYGGWWFDSTLYVASAEWFETVFERIQSTGSVFCGVCHIQCPTILIESSFIYASKGSPLMKAWLDESEQLFAIGQRNYIYAAYRNSVTFPYYLFEPYPYMYPYMSIFVSFEVVLQRVVSRKTPILILKDSESLFQLHTSCNFNMNCMIDRVREDIENPSFPVVKVNTWLRKHIWPDSARQSVDVIDDLHPLRSGSNSSREVVWNGLFHGIVLGLTFTLSYVHCLSGVFPE